MSITTINDANELSKSNKCDLQTCRSNIQICNFFGEKPPSILKIDGLPESEYVKTVNATILRTTNISKKQQKQLGYIPKYNYFLNFNNLGQIENGNYVFIFKKKTMPTYYGFKNYLKYNTYKTNKVDENLNETELTTRNKARISMGQDIEIKTGKCIVYLYKYKSVPLYATDFQLKTNIDGIIFSDIIIKKRNLIRIRKDDEKYYNYMSYLNPQKDIEEGKYPMFIINNKEQFLQWNAQLQHGDLTQFLYKQIKDLYSTFFIDNPQLITNLHPYYKLNYLDNIKEELIQQINNIDNWKSLLYPLFQIHLSNYAPPLYQDIRKIRREKYGSIFIDNKYNNEKILSFLREQQLDEIKFPTLIKSDYNWWILHEAVELVKKINNYNEIKDNKIQLSTEVFKIYKQILQFEYKNYQGQIE